MKVSIKLKTSLITISLLISVLLVTGVVATFSARNGITRMAVRLLSFKANELQKYMTNQWQLLVDNKLNEDETFIDTAQQAISSFSSTLLQSDTEMIFAFADDGSGDQSLVMYERGGDTEVDFEVLQAISSLDDVIDSQQGNWVRFSPDYFVRVGQYFFFEPFSWHVFLTENDKTFMVDADTITYQTILITVLAVICGLIINIFLVGYILRPIGKTVDAMKYVIREGDMETKVMVESRDELGQLAQTFNVMIGELNQAYHQIKNYALEAVLARRNESKIKNVFQKYVPSSVINSLVERPESALIGDNRSLTIMFTDIRSFTSISEQYRPDQLVLALNQYFEGLVDIIVKHGGIIDKYIGDAILAVFGAPVQLKDSSLAALVSAIEMQDMLQVFNADREKRGDAPFRTGIGIAHGKVTVGNIGTDKKMDYTVIGDTVNLCSRLESLNKPYKQSILFDKQVAQRAVKQYPDRVRFVDIVQVQGKTTGEHIYTVIAPPTEKVKEALGIYSQATKLYYERSFDKALKDFRKVKRLMPNDHITQMFLERAQQYAKNPPDEDWQGIAIATQK